MTMPMSANGMVNIAGIDTDISQNGGADRSENVLAQEVFNDELERAGESTLTMKDSRQVLIGTTLGELVNVNPNNLRITNLGMPAGTASSILNMYDAGPDVIIGTRSPDYRNATNRGSGQVVKLKYVCTYTQCSDQERWTKYGAPVPENTHVYGASSWNGVIFAGSGDTKATLSVYENGQWREMETIGVAQPGQSGKAERITQVRVMGDYLYLSYQGNNSIKVGTHIYKLGKDKDGKVTLNWIRQLKDMAWVTSPVATNMGYSTASVIYKGPGGDSLRIFDPAAGSKGTETVWGTYPAQQMPDQNALGALPISSCWLVPGHICATWYPGGSDIVLAAKPQSPNQANQGTAKRIASISPSGAVIINSGRREISRLAVGPGNSGLFASTSYFGHYIRQIDPKTGQTKDLTLRPWRDPLGGAPQVEGLRSVGDQLLAGIYPQNGTISQIDPAKPITCEYQIDRPTADCNPTITTSERVIGNNQARPVAIADLGNGQAAIGSFGSRNNITGVLTFYDTAAKKITNQVPLKDSNGIRLSHMGVSVIADQDLTRTGGWIYYGTNAAPPDNPSTEPAAAIVRYNVNTGQAQAIAAPRKLVSDLKFGADGRLYAMTGFTFLTIDPGLNGKPFSILSSTNIGRMWEAPGASMAPLADGTFAVVAGSGDYYPGPLYLIDPRGSGSPKATPLGEWGYRIVAVDSPSGQGSRWFYNRGTGVYHQDQPNTAGALR
ncbi:hypothetical protein ODZ83_09945 [Acaricomes phytoseiuli]|uniref:hypothetical protein n=1 Tax=Acaricomes phytoseiuli TaxID=291968 RepID=UPI0012E9E53E|nr:hypothetical protein [Acaricomes phytoseiuli]MCW1250491.1 hypothetical protein [Acaricomes phytoseiuli]